MTFVRVDPDGETTPAGPAPYLDLRPVAEQELSAAEAVASRFGDKAELERQARELAVETLAQDHLAQTRLQILPMVERTRAAVHERLGAEIRYWDHRARQLQEQVEAGHQPKLQPEMAQRRVDDLELRRRRRLAELDAEARLSSLPPVLVGLALVVPARAIDGRTSTMAAGHTVETEIVERRAVDAVLAAERSLGRRPEEMARNNPGYDLRSKTVDGHYLLIEVKGRIEGAESFSVTKNEIMTGLNAERFVLALVEVSMDEGRPEQVRYIRDPFQGADAPFFGTASATFRWSVMWDRGDAPS